MWTHAPRAFIITRRAFVAALLASLTLGIGIGELAGPLASSQAHPRASAAAAPAACDRFATNVGQAFSVLGTILEDAAKYPPFIPQAATAGAQHSISKLKAIASKVTAVTSSISKQATRFEQLKGPILSEERSCLHG